MRHWIALTEEDLAQLAPTDQDHARKIAALPDATHQQLEQLVANHPDWDDQDIHSRLAIDMGIDDYQLGFDERTIGWFRRAVA
jgi:hypothetical protein